MWSLEERKLLLDECVKSGKTKREFCRERGINIGTFYGWIKQAKQKRKITAVKHKPKFHEISVPVAVAPAVEIIMPGGARVCLRGSGKTDDLAKLIRGIVGF